MTILGFFPVALTVQYMPTSRLGACNKWHQRIPAETTNGSLLELPIDRQIPDSTDTFLPNLELNYPTTGGLILFLYFPCAVACTGIGCMSFNAAQFHISFVIARITPVKNIWPLSYF